MTEAEFRARIRALMTSGALPSEPPVISGTGVVSAVKKSRLRTPDQGLREHSFDTEDSGAHWFDMDNSLDS